MTLVHVEAAPDAEAEIRWQEWKARGLVQDRRTASIMGRLMIPVAIALVAWVAVQLVRL